MQTIAMRKACKRGGNNPATTCYLLDSPLLSLHVHKTGYKYDEENQ